MSCTWKLPLSTMLSAPESRRLSPSSLSRAERTKLSDCSMRLPLCIVESALGSTDTAVSDCASMGRFTRGSFSWGIRPKVTSWGSGSKSMGPDSAATKTSSASLWLVSSYKNDLRMQKCVSINSIYEILDGPLSIANKGLAECCTASAG